MDEFGQLHAALLARDPMNRIHVQPIQNLQVEFVNNRERIPIQRFHNPNLRRQAGRPHDAIAGRAYPEPKVKRIKVDEDVLR